MKRTASFLALLLTVAFLALPHYVDASYPVLTIDSYSESNKDTDYSVLDNHPSNEVGEISSCSQSFNASDDYYLLSVKFYLKKFGSPTGNAVAVLYAHSGTFGTSSLPTGAALATSDAFNVATLTTSYALITFTFSGANQYQMTAGTKYCIAYQTPAAGIDNSNFVYLGYDNSGPTHAGNSATFVNGAWSYSSIRDLCFYIYGIPTNYPYEYTFTGSYYENGTKAAAVDVTASVSGTTDEFQVDGPATHYYNPEPDAFYWDIGGGLTRYVYSVGSENITATLPEDAAYSYGFTINDYTGKSGLGDTHLEAYRTINGTETLIERMKITQPNPTPLNLVYGRTYHIKIRYADGTRYDWGYFLAGADTSNTIIARSTSFTDQAHFIYQTIRVEATRSGGTITVDYNDTRDSTTWSNVTITQRGGGTMFQATRSNSTYTLNWTGANTSQGYIVSVNGVHGDYGEWGYVRIFDTTETFPAAPSLDDIFDFGLGANLGGWVITVAAMLGFSKALKTRALLVGAAVATLLNYIGFAQWTSNQLIFAWFFSIAVALATGGIE